MLKSIINASPGVLNLGTEDKSTVAIFPSSPLIPQHLPKFYFLGEKGTSKPVLVSGSEATLLYGTATFDQLDKFYNHVTRFIEKTIGKANTFMGQRLIPTDAGPEANFRLYIDIVSDDIANYERNSDGTIATDVGGVPIVVVGTETIPGYRIKLIKEHIDINREDNIVVGTIVDSTDYTITLDGVAYTYNSGVGATAETIIAGLIVALAAAPADFAITATNATTINIRSNFKTGTYLVTGTANLTVTNVVQGGTGLVLGAGTSKTGTMTNIAAQTSTMYPIADFKASEKGLYYNNIGIDISIPSADSIPSAMLSDTKVIPYNLGLVRRDNEKSSPKVFKTLMGETFNMFSFKDGAINPLTTKGFDLNNVFPGNWFNETDPVKPLVYNDYADTYVYHANINTVLDMVMALEKAAISSIPVTWYDGLDAATLSWFDFTTSDPVTLAAEETNLINFITGKSTGGVKYMTFIMDETTPTLTGTQKEVQLGAGIPVYLNGGSDGSLDNTTFESLVVTELDKYIDPASEVMDPAINVESIMYDSGFTLNTKKSLANFIALRKDTGVVLSTHDAALGDNYVNLTDQRAIATVLRTTLQLTPESTYFGTEVMRGMVVTGTGRDPYSPDKTRIANTYDVLSKVAAYMGAGDGKWKPIYSFSAAPGNIISELIDIEPEFIPETSKPALWDAGMVWPQPYDRMLYHFPAFQTVYTDDTSVLNSFITVMAICTLNKVAYEAHRRFTGTDDQSNDQLADSVVGFVNGRLNGIFGGRFTIVPEVLFTQLDKDRGYSWKLVTKIYAGSMKTVMTHSVEAYRLSQL